MAASDARGLFDSLSAAPKSPGGTTTRGAAAERRDKLYPFDAAAVQCLNPYGQSQFTAETTSRVWDMINKGSKRVRFHSELAATESYRVGVGLSRTAETLKEGIASLQDETMKRVLNQELLDKALEEANTLLPHLEALNFGKGSETGSETATLSALKRRKVESAVAPPSEETVKAAADALRDWLQKDGSPLRGLLSVLAAGGSIWSAHVAEKVARSAVLHKPLEGPAMREAALARRKAPAQQQSTGASGSKDAEGLFSG